jgi:sugar fermentation stimulation protein A
MTKKAIDTSCIEGTNAGVYHLLLSLTKSTRLHVGSLGLRTFPPGFFVYTGRARRGLASRLRRHLGRQKTNHWHIDWLTKIARVEEIWVDLGPGQAECENHRQVFELPGAKTLVPRFGSSDCHCPSHLVYFAKRPTLKRKGNQKWQQILNRSLGSARR